MTADYPTAAGPTVHRTAWIAPTADVTGEVTLGPDSSVWFQCVLRGDIAPIHIGAESNVQDLTIVHVDIDRPCHVGDRRVSHRRRTDRSPDGLDRADGRRDRRCHAGP